MPNSYYSFLPYLRQGLAGMIDAPDFSSVTNRATISVNLAIKGNGNVINTNSTTPANSVTQVVNVKGPGDITGINRNEIIRVYPRNETINSEPNYLAGIEFYDEDFPWRYTPAKAVHNSNSEYQLRPWITLIVLEEGEFTDVPFNGIAPSITVAQNLLPPPGQIWAWAHVHVNKELNNVSNVVNATNLQSEIDTLHGTLKSNPDIAVSRILCPRKLLPNKRYHAFLIPSFELGRQAGINAASPTGDALAAAWDTSGTQKEFPVYYRWFFRTGEDADFEELVSRIKPITLNPNTVGKRLMDLQLPGIPDLDLDADPNYVYLQAVLYPPGATEDTTWPGTNDGLVSSLKDVLNKPTQLLKAGNSVDPIVGPPVYGRWHAALQPDSNGNLLATNTGMTANWIYRANLDPRYRVYAGIGAEVVRNNQDKYMEIAWEQIGEVLEANRKIRNMQLAMRATLTLHERTFAPSYAAQPTLSNELVINIAGNAHGRVGILDTNTNTTETVFKKVKDSIIPNSMFSGAFRRITRPASSLMVTMNAAGAGSANTAAMITAINSNNVSFAKPAPAPSAAKPGPAAISSFSISNFNVTGLAVLYR